MDWMQLGTSFGVPLLILGALSFFLRRDVWPLVVKRVEGSVAERKEERKEFLDALDKQGRRIEDVASALESLTSAIRDMQRSEVKPTRRVNK